MGILDAMSINIGEFQPPQSGLCGFGLLSQALSPMQQAMVSSAFAQQQQQRRVPFFLGANSLCPPTPRKEKEPRTYIEKQLAKKTYVDEQLAEL